MKILVIAHYQNDGSPTAIFVHDQILEYRKLGHELLVVVPIAIGKKDLSGQRFSHSVTETAIDGVNHVFIRFISLSSLGNGWFNPNSCKLSVMQFLYEKIKKFNPDVIHAHTFGVDSELGYLLKKKLKKKLVVTTHGSDTTSLYLKGKERCLVEYANKCDLIVCVSSKLREILCKCGVTSQISTITNGFKSENLCRCEDCDNLRIERLMNKEIVLNQTCNLVSSKQVDITIKAFKKIHETLCNSRLIVVGDGPLKEELKSLAVSLGVEKSILFTGRLNNHDALKQMANSDFFIMPSINEGLGIVYIEAMASGCLTIGTKGEGVEDIIENGRNGYLIPAGDYDSIAEIVLNCVNNPENMGKITTAGINSALKYTWNANAMEYTKLFCELLEMKEQ